ncbi:ribosome-binding protein 1-like isoform X9 [Palaemon carinicauda]|uniref:ribosome-binding protein 1-like isoform X9 n=1 Tax=Palaemon carinicauda TaxID=392227 RepID=UPI0035B5C072
MDVFVLGGVVLVLTVVVYILATLGTKETPFEVALAEQRQMREQETAPVKSEKMKYYRPKPKKQKVRKDTDTEPSAKAAAAPVVVTEPESEPEPKQEPTPTPTPPASVVEPQPSPQPPQDKKKDKKNKKKEKDERKAKEVAAAPETKAPAPKEQQVQEKVEEVVVTKAEAPKSESKKPEPTPEPAPLPQTKESKKEVEAPVKRQQIEIIEAVETQVVQNATPAAPAAVPATGKVTPTQEKKEKKKKEKGPATSGQGDMKLVSLVQQSALSGNMIQLMIDILLDKQQQNNDGGEWVEKGKVDPLTQMRKQLEDVQSRLQDKDEAHKALTAKISDLRSELNGERSRAIKLKSQLDDTIANHTRQQEIAATNALSAQTAKLNDLRKELEQEYKTKMDQQQQILEQLKGSSDEAEITKLHSSLSEAEMQANMARQKTEELRLTYDEHIRKLEEKLAAEEVNKNAQLAELHTQLANTDAARAKALAESTALAAERDSLSVQLSSENNKYAQLQHKMQETLREKTEVDSRLIQVESELSSVRQVVLDQTNQIERLKEEKESLASQSVRPAAEGQENGDVHAEQSVAIDTTHLESLVKEKDILIEQHVSEVKNLNKEISRLKEDLESQRTKNNELREKNHKVMEALSSTEGKLVARLRQVDDMSGEIDLERAKVRAVLRRISPDVQVDDTLDQEAFLNEFETKASQVSTQTTISVPEVVEKVVEIEKVVEKEVKVMVEDPALKSKVEELVKENAELKTQVAEFQKSIPKVDDSKRVSELEEEVKSVNEKVSHYQKVLADTEDLLRTLQASVESEEVTWNKKLSEKEHNIKQLTADKANLELQIGKLEGTLDKVRQAEEMDSQLKVLQEQLQKEEKEKALLQQQLQDAQEQLTKTATQGGSDEESIRELRLENEKLLSLVTVGQDESREQDQLIQQLQQELAAVKSASTNGPANEEQCQEGAGAK